MKPTRKNEPRPLALIAKAMKLKPSTLYARYKARGVHIRGMDAEQLVANLAEQDRAKYLERIRKALSLDEKPVPVPQLNPHNGVEILDAKGPPGFKPDIAGALIALTRASRAIGPLRADQQTEVSQSIGDAFIALRGSDPKRRKP